MITGVHLKEGVRISGVRPELLIGVVVACGVYERMRETFVITAMLDGKHMDGSLHYKGLAFDCRLPSWYQQPRPAVVPTPEDHALQEELKRELGDDFDVVLEGDHIHIEYDPPAPKEQIA